MTNNKKITNIYIWNKKNKKQPQKIIKKALKNKKQPQKIIKKAIKNK